MGALDNIQKNYYTFNVKEEAARKSVEALDPMNEGSDYDYDKGYITSIQNKDSSFQITVALPDISQDIFKNPVFDDLAAKLKKFKSLENDRLVYFATKILKQRQLGFGEDDIHSIQSALYMLGMAEDEKGGKDTDPNNDESAKRTLEDTVLRNLGYFKGPEAEKALMYQDLTHIDEWLEDQQKKRDEFLKESYDKTGWLATIFGGNLNTPKTCSGTIEYAMPPPSFLEDPTDTIPNVEDTWGKFGSTGSWNYSLMNFQADLDGDGAQEVHTEMMLTINLELDTTSRFYLGTGEKAMYFMGQVNLRIIDGYIVSCSFITPSDMAGTMEISLFRKVNNSSSYTQAFASNPGLDVVDPKWSENLYTSFINYDASGSIIPEKAYPVTRSKAIRIISSIGERIESSAINLKNGWTANEATAFSIALGNLGILARNRPLKPDDLVRLQTPWPNYKPLKRNELETLKQAADTTRSQLAKAATSAQNAAKQAEVSGETSQEQAAPSASPQGQPTYQIQDPSGKTITVNQEEYDALKAAGKIQEGPPATQ